MLQTTHTPCCNAYGHDESSPFECNWMDEARALLARIGG